MVYCNSGVLEKGGISWEVGGVWEKCEAPRDGQGMKGFPAGVEVEGWGWGDLFVFMYFMLFLR